ncbi:MAG: hypothetical protein QOG43_3495 [Actinomycetota bacterium]|jgi:nucleotide-binding universal stress UspA family protein|nr:hypothetical protein [Actinomycetota bacterium]
MTIQDEITLAPVGVGVEVAVGPGGAGVIVVGVDAAEVIRDAPSPSSRAVAYAAGLARCTGSRLVVVWVGPPTSISDRFVDTKDGITHDLDHLTTGVRSVIDRMAQGFGVPATVQIVRESEPSAGLIGVAEDLHADEIVVGASAHRLGSVVARLVRDARGPVTVVP